MIRIFIALSCLVLLAYGSEDAPSLRGGSPKEAMELEEQQLEQGKRRLTLPGVPCESYPGPVNNFELSFDLVPQGGFNLGGCTARKRRLLGKAINNLLQDYGIGDLGVGDDAAFVAEVCTSPSSRRRRLSTTNWTYNGGGKCRFCNDDDFDGRKTRFLESGVDSSRRQLTDPNWFNNIYKPEMQNTLRNEFTNNVAPNHVACLGNGPQVNPVITEISNEPDTSC